jgi:hypothetical protein
VARLGERYRAELATLAEALDSWATEGLIELLAPIDRVSTAVVSTLIGLEMCCRLDPDAVDDGAVVAALRALAGALVEAIAVTPAGVG